MKAKVSLNAIPAVFFEWLAFSRVSFLNDMREGKPVHYFSAHLPVMSTWDRSSPFPVNMTVKGIGLVPMTEYLRNFTDIFESVIAEASTSAWAESLYKRTQVVQRLYENMGNLDPAILGGLEIFEGKTLCNLRENPYASLHYTGTTHDADRMHYVSFQVNGKVEILEKDNPYYRFLLASRKLFEFDRFHIYQPDYPSGYLIRVIEVINKSPWSRKYELDRG